MHKVVLYFWKGWLEIEEHLFTTFEEASAFAEDAECREFKIYDHHNHLVHGGHRHHDYPRHHDFYA